MLDDLTKLASQKYVSPYFLAGIYVGLGESGLAIENLEKCYEEHSHWLIYLHIDPSMESLRDNRDFQALLRRVGLPLTSASSMGPVGSVIARTANYFRSFDSLPFKLGDPICFRGCFCSRSSLARRRSPLLENFWIPFRKVFGAIHPIRGSRCIVEEQQ